MKLFFTLILLLVTLTTGAQAVVFLKDYETAKEQQWFQHYINGVGIGFVWANARLDRAPDFESNIQESG